MRGDKEFLLDSSFKKEFPLPPYRFAFPGSFLCPLTTAILRTRYEPSLPPERLSRDSPISAHFFDAPFPLASHLFSFLPRRFLERSLPFYEWLAPMAGLVPFLSPIRRLFFLGHALARFFCQVSPTISSVEEELGGYLTIFLRRRRGISHDSFPGKSFSLTIGEEPSPFVALNLLPFKI